MAVFVCFGGKFKFGTKGTVYSCSGKIYPNFYENSIKF